MPFWPSLRPAAQTRLPTRLLEEVWFPAHACQRLVASLFASLFAGKREVPPMGGDRATDECRSSCACKGSRGAARRKRLEKASRMLSGPFGVAPGPRAASAGGESASKRHRGCLLDSLGWLLVADCLVGRPWHASWLLDRTSPGLGSLCVSAFSFSALAVDLRWKCTAISKGSAFRQCISNGNALPAECLLPHQWNLSS